MKILIVPDSFKGSASSIAVAAAIERGFTRVLPHSSYRSVPMADGGEGSLEALHASLGGEWISVDTVDPLLRPMQAKYLLVEGTAYIEMAAASGLILLSPGERSAGQTSTRGTGLLLADALDRGVHKIVLFIGGSATNDAGTGIASALGYQFRDEAGEEISPVGNTLRNIATIHAPDLRREFEFTVLCDVTNPFTGPNGATHIYGPQKGAGSQDLIQLEAGMVYFQGLLEKWSGKDLNALPGSGAAGGVGGGMSALFNARIQSGIKFFLDKFDIKSQIAWADLIITGEGKLDGQSPQGKLISGIAGLCQKHHKTVIAICGAVKLSSAATQLLGLTSAFSILTEISSEDDALKNAVTNIEESSAQIANLIKRLRQQHD